MADLDFPPWTQQEVTERVRRVEKWTLDRQTDQTLIKCHQRFYERCLCLRILQKGSIGTFWKVLLKEHFILQVRKFQSFPSFLKNTTTKNKQQKQV